MKTIFIYLLTVFSLLTAQSVNIKGKIVSANTKEPLAGVNIYIENSLIGSASDANGFYQIRSVPASAITLIFSCMGYAEKTVSMVASSDTTLNVALSQTILDGPIVTTIATQARETDASITYSNLHKKELVKRYDTQDIPELLSDLPSTTYYSENGNGIGYNYLSIRGFDQRRISVLVNGIPQNDPEDHNVYWLDFPDLAENIQTIQVQRGAGNAFYGPAAIGGSINIKTDHFSPEKKIKASFGAGSYNTKKYSAAYNSGLWDNKYIFSTRLSHITSDGYRDRSWVDFWSYFFGMARYGQNNSLRLHFYGGPIKDGLSYLFIQDENAATGGIPKFLNDNSTLRTKNWGYFSFDSQADTLTYSADRRKDEKENFNQPHFEILHEWQLNRDFSLNNNFFFIKGYGFFDFDGGWADTDFYRLSPQYGYDSLLTIPQDALIRGFVDNDQIGWLPQLTMASENGEIIIGAELRYHRSLHWGRLQKGSGLPANLVGNGARHYYEYKGGKDIASLYYRQNYKFSDDLTVQTDLQYAFKQYHLFDEAFVGNDFSTPYHFINPRLGLNFKISDLSSIYTSVYSTSREPQLKNLYNAGESSNTWEKVAPQFELKRNGSYNFNKPLVKPETLTGIEFGLSFKNSVIDGTANLYYMDFINEIIKNGKIDRFGQPSTGNAEKTVHYGVEFAGRVRILPELFFDANLTVSANEIKEMKQYTDDSTFISLKNNPIAGFPAVLANTRLTYLWQDLYISLAAKYSGDSYTDNFKNKEHKLDPYTVLNLITNYKLKSVNLNMFTVQFKINNLLNTKYLSYGEAFVFYPAATRNYFLTLKMDL